jgi:hypothetical protein
LLHLALDNPVPLSAICKKHPLQQEVVMTAEVFKFPHDDKDVIISLMKTAQRLEETSADQCIKVQRDIINLLLLECRRSNIRTRVVVRALKTLSAE